MRKFLASKKNRYAIYSITVTLLLLWFSFRVGDSEMPLGVLLLLFLTAVGGTAFTHYPGISFKNVMPLTLLPLHLVGGAAFSLLYFPNLSFLFKVVALFIGGALLYIINLVNNIFLVVEERREVIPLFRVAITWSQILLIVVAIPFFAGVFKSSLVFFVQNMVVAVSSFLFSLYLLWTFSFKKDIKKVAFGESILISSFISFVVFCLGIAVSFIPTESFLRALFVAAALMFGISYVQGHYRNKIHERLLLEYGLILTAFLFIVLVFTP